MENNSNQDYSIILDKILQVQKNDIILRTQEHEFRNKDYELKEKELEVKSKEDERAFTFSIKAIEEHASDRKNTREHLSKFAKHAIWATVLIVMLALLFLCYTIYSGNANIAMEIIKIGGTAIITGGGGTAAGYSLGLKKSNNIEEPEPNGEKN